MIELVITALVLYVVFGVAYMLDFAQRITRNDRDH